MICMGWRTSMIPCSTLCQEDASRVSFTEWYFDDTAMSWSRWYTTARNFNSGTWPITSSSCPRHSPETMAPFTLLLFNKNARRSPFERGSMGTMMAPMVVPAIRL